MSDARTLLRAKRQESSARISHPYASYTSTGTLRCLACSVPVKSAGMWEGHIGSKAHRVAVRTLKTKEEQEEKEREMKRNGKRKAEDDGIEMDVDTAEENVNGTVPTNNAKKRRTSVESEPTQPPSSKTKGFPADFFSDPSQAPILSTADEDEDGGEEPGTAQPNANAPSDKPKSQIDLEWEQFQASLLNPSAAVEEQEDERRAAFERATVVAEPELVPSAPGFPPAVTGETEPLEEKKEETDEEKQRRKEQEDRELIMDRLIEEERVQEEADERVGLLRARVEALKKAREAKRKAK
ncbi:uncharacterized protein FOMMEDRAFT_131423 [Fomitiporia mediterranea MF3/22]|uniref:uncharacterized protein n=1 Tax=Fomitiporia mediterranea (strain MF3/22) TaxID=694068 RepID=UPI000440922B|nr:uncharacterized protein FOMMEDRAFT_131423 [Fomitiporia mediterranea MF3/22]EJD06487.1 hypothetical protein FOMMEDRAFT_131423 [Fomitiporia mediterranea MF3/22]